MLGGVGLLLILLLLLLQDFCVQLAVKKIVHQMALGGVLERQIQYKMCYYLFSHNHQMTRKLEDKQKLFIVSTHLLPKITLHGNRNDKVLKLHSRPRWDTKCTRYDIFSFLKRPILTPVLVLRLEGVKNGCQMHLFIRF